MTHPWVRLPVSLLLIVAGSVSTFFGAVWLRLRAGGDVDLEATGIALVVSTVMSGLTTLVVGVRILFRASASPCPP
jgi:hypothetical protein